MRSWKIFVLLLLTCSGASAFESRLPFKTVFKGQDQFNRLVSRASSGNWKSLPMGERTAAVGQALVGTRYKHFTLEIDNRIESPSVNFQRMDCWTFFEISLAFARMLDEPEENWTPDRLLHYIEVDLIAAANAPANIFRVSITWKIGWRITTGAVWLKTSRAAWAAALFPIRRAK